MSVYTEISDEEILREDMPDSQSQTDNGDEIKDVLVFQHRDEDCFVGADLAVVPPDDRAYSFQYLSPDVSFFKGVVVTPEERRTLSSWRMRLANRPAPTVVFEISSRETWPNDLNPKPAQYGEMGVKEYFAYDPNHFWPSEPRLRGWRYRNGVPIPIEPVAGRLWSEELASWLVIEDFVVRFYDAAGQRRLKRDEALAEQLDEVELERERERQRADAEQQRAERERFRAETERLRAEEAEGRADTERRAKQAQQRRAKEARRQAKQAQQRANEAQARVEAAQLRADAEQQRAEQARQELTAQENELAQAKAEIERQRVEMARLREQLKLPPDA